MIGMILSISMIMSLIAMGIDVRGFVFYRLRG
jgi:hypothetical protein